MTHAHDHVATPDGSTPDDATPDDTTPDETSPGRHGAEPARLPAAPTRRQEYTSASTVTVAFVVGACLIGWLLRWYTDGRLTGGYRPGAAFYTWLGLVALSAGVLVVVFVAGVVSLSRHAGAKDRVFDGIAPRLWRYLAWHLLLGCGVGGLMAALGGGGFEVPIEGWSTLRLAIPMGAIAAVTPWVMTVWLTHDELAALKSSIASGADPTRAVPALCTAWRAIERSTGALVVTVTVGVVTTGALRLALIAPGLTAPSQQDVVRYGLFFAVVVAVVVVPLLLAYRRRAGELVDRVHPPESRTSTSDAEVQVLRGVLHLDTGPLRSPWALLGVLTPVVTGALAAYLPGLK